MELPQLIHIESLHGVLRSLHGFSADVLLYLALLHGGAALYHQFWLKDGLMQRIWN
jgi:cytochrome b561